jgi:hypothetical protein
MSSGGNAVPCLGGGDRGGRCCGSGRGGERVSECVPVEVGVCDDELGQAGGKRRLSRQASSPLPRGERTSTGWSRRDAVAPKAHRADAVAAAHVALYEERHDEAK